MGNTDRTMIAAMMVPHFPTMADTAQHKYTSDEWHGFMNAQTGLEIDPEESNTTAFDKWRQALAESADLPVWGYTKEQIAKMKERGEELKRLEDARAVAEAATLKALAAEAPSKTAEQLIQEAKK